MMATLRWVTGDREMCENIITLLVKCTQVYFFVEKKKISTYFEVKEYRLIFYNWTTVK